MISGSVALLWLLIGGTATPTIDQVTYAAPTTRFASATLLVNGQSDFVQILDQNNIEIKVIPAEYQDLKISKQVDIECIFPQSYRLTKIGARADSRYHLIPLDIIEYKEYNPSYVKLEINKAFFVNGTDESDTSNHQIYIDFFTTDK